MHHKRGQHGLREAGRPSFLGDGLLERARATSIALLGATAAVGLSIVALALNQGWPLIAASSIPPLPRQERAVGPAAALAPVSTSHPGPTGTSHGDSRRDRSAPPRVASVAADAGAGAGAPAGVVVSSSEPVERSGGGDHNGVTDHNGGTDHVAPKPPAKAPPQPQPVQQAPATTVVSSPPAPEPAPAPTPEPVPAPTPAPTAPVASASETPPEESGPPSWSHGGGHAYGRDED